jgi:outer membrane protein assembly factor BamB
MKMKALHCLGIVALLLLCAPMAPVYPDTGGYIWRASTGGKIRGRPVATRNGTVYTLSEDRHVYALDEETGAVEWRAFLGGRVWDSLCIGADGTIYTVLKDGDLVAVGPGGTIAWKFKATGVPVGNPAAVHDGTVYVALDTGILLAVSHTGRERWRVNLPAPPTTGPAVGVNGDIYMGTVDKRVFAYHPWGEESWSALLAGVPAEPAISPDGTIIYGTDYGSVVALDPTGDILWDLVADEGFLSPVLSVDRILAATTGGEVIALDPDGTVLWRNTTGERLTGSLSVTAGNDLIALSERGYLLRYRDDGQLAERFDVRGSGTVFGVTPTGKYVFGRDDWLVYAFQGSFPAGSGWPQPGGNPQHTSNGSARVGSDTWFEAFRDDADYLYLYHMTNNQAPEFMERALFEMEETIDADGVIPPYYQVFLEDLASEGTLRAGMEYGAITNDFPVIRSAAARLLGKIGTLQSADLLVRLLTYEYDTGVQRQLIAAIGALMTDRKGLATAAISKVVLSDLWGRETPDPRLAGAALGSLELINRYHGRMPDESGNELLFAIYRGAYPRETREAALGVIRRLRR